MRLPAVSTQDWLLLGNSLSGADERVGLAGWIIDRRLAKDVGPDQEEVKMAINNLREAELVRITEMRRLEATATGERLWRMMN